MQGEDFIRLDERFVKDFGIKIDLNIVGTPYFIDRLVQYETYQKGTLKKYNEFTNYVKETFETMDDYYIARNDFISALISFSEEKEIKYGLKGNSMKEYKIPKRNISSSSIYNQERTNKKFISIDLKSASFQARKFFNPELVGNCANYEDFVKTLTDYKYFDNKRIRNSAFGRCCISQVITLEKFIINKIVDIILKYESEENIVTLVTDEVIFYETDNLPMILADINDLSKEIDIEFHKEAFILTKFVSTKGYLKEVRDLDTGIEKKIFADIPAAIFPVALALYNKEPLKDSYLYFYDEGVLCKRIASSFNTKNR